MENTPKKKLSLGIQIFIALVAGIDRRKAAKKAAAN